MGDWQRIDTKTMHPLTHQQNQLSLITDMLRILNL
jgi:hypothetical protein